MPRSSRLEADGAVNLLGVTKSAFFVINPAFSRSLVCYATRLQDKISAHLGNILFAFLLIWGTGLCNRRLMH